MFKKLFILALSILMGITSLYSQDPKEIFQKYFEFRGDTKARTEINAIHIKASQTQAGMVVTSDYYRNGDKVYIFSSAMGQETKVGYDGDSLWLIQAGKSQVIPSEYKDQFLNQFKSIENMIIGPEPKDLEEDVELEFSGEVEENGRKAYVVNIINNEKETETFVYFDKNNYEIFKMFREVPGKDDQVITIDMSFSDYKKIDGFNVNFPFKVEMSINGQNTKIEYETIELNPTIDEKIFKMPKN